MAGATGWRGLNGAPHLAAQPEAGAGDDWPHDASNAWAEVRKRFAAVMDDNLSTSAALAVLIELAQPLLSLANCLERGATKAATDRQALQAEPRLLLDRPGVLGVRPEVESAPDAQAVGAPSEEDVPVQ